MSTAPTKVSTADIGNAQEGYIWHFHVYPPQVIGYIAPYGIWHRLPNGRWLPACGSG